MSFVNSNRRRSLCIWVFPYLFCHLLWDKCHLPYIAESLVQSSPLLGSDGHCRHQHFGVGWRRICNLLRLLLQFKLQRIYWATVSRRFSRHQSDANREVQTLTSAMAAASTLSVRAHRSPKWRTLRGGVFAILGVSAMLPIFHSIGLLGWKQAKVQIGAQWFLAKGLSLLTAVLIFVVSGMIDSIPSPNLIIK